VNGFILKLIHFTCNRLGFTPQASEMDTPHALLEEGSGIFASLVNNTGSKSAKELHARAKRQFEQTNERITELEVLRACGIGKKEIDVGYGARIQHSRSPM
jgi:activator of 2-hydroxyglutaryl-CoA dehydratase